MITILLDHNLTGFAPILIRCVERLIEIIFDLERLRGTPRLFIP